MTKEPTTIATARLTGLTVHYANGLDRLVLPLADKLRQERGGWRNALFEQPCIIVPNRNVATYLKLELARLLGASGALHFPYLENFLAEVVAKSPQPGLPRLAGEEMRIAGEEHIHTALIALLRADPRMADGTWAAPAAYINANAATGDTRDERIFQLAGRLAGLFREYAYGRPAMLRAWREGKFVLQATPFAETERWQRELWLALFGASGLLVKHGWKLLHEAWQEVDPATLTLPKGVHIFGLSYVGQSVLEVLDRLARHTAVSIYSVNPCAEFWEDVPAGWRIPYHDAFARRDARLSEEERAADDPYGLASGGDTPLLRAWGRPGREQIRLLNDLSDCNIEAHFPDAPAEQAAPTLLARVQQDIMLRVPERKQDTRLQHRDDGSLRVLACPGVLREVEIVASEIWNLVARDPTLRFDQIAVIVNPQSKDTYFPHLEAVFERLHRVPFAIADRSIRGGARIAEAIELLLRLPLGNFARNEMLRLMVHPNVCGRWPDVVPEEWLRWGERLGILFGADAASIRAETYVEEDLLNWDQGIRRLALGAFMAGEPGTLPRVYETEWGRCIPEAPEAGRTVSAGVFIALARSLLADADACRQERPLADWADYMAGLVRAYLHAGDDTETNILNRCTRDLQELAALDVTGEPVSYRIAAELALATVSAVESPKGHYLADGVSVSTFLPMRAIPFRAVFLLGMGEGEFPAADPKDPLDLRPAKRQAGDVSRREKDKYMFLETLLAARERLYLSYVARDAKTGDPLAPASVVQELLYLLKTGYLAEGQSVTHTHPLNRYADAYFTPGAKLVSHDPAAAREAVVAKLRAEIDQRLRGALPPRWEVWREILAPDVVARLEAELAVVHPPVERVAEERTELSLAAIRRFLDCPLQASARMALGLREDEDDNILDAVDEPFHADRLSLTLTLREVFMRGGDPAAKAARLQEALRILELQGKFPTGIFAAVATNQARAVLEAWQRNAERLGIPQRLLSVQFGRSERPAPIDQNAGLLTLPSGMRLYGLCDPLAGDGKSLDACVLLRTGGEPKAKDFLHGFLNGVYLTAHGLRDESKSFRVVVLPGAEAEETEGLHKIFRPFSRQTATEYLETLAADISAGFQAELLPVEAVLNYLGCGDAKKADRLRDAVSALVNSRNGHSSLYGPIRDITPFQPPDEEDALAKVHRRFSLFADSLEEAVHA
jgi:exodeoxyribonuclease V gamma subunit